VETDLPKNFERIDVVCANNRNMPSSGPSPETPILLDVSMANFPWSLQEFNNKYKDCSFMEGVNNVEILKTICNLHCLWLYFPENKSHKHGLDGIN
jgi:hypothetical protein